ncbi:DUF998 domain-containing protein [Kribbella sp. CA-293567]|uniref:DUF998 domain-containing protein n=1 Tax=Kribbella sp. CA-293567 TaxID=3002436 RepID=UPI0022DD1F92|nr:DUF998 domain-containing protein [Kribbella sp. CA-293567]WBQ07299.1 DUF998 domain-containing protein [Kribbella sp. CA-293567]
MDRRQWPAARICWLLAPLLYFGLQVFVASAWPVPYQFLDHTISDLGWTTCTIEQRPSGVLASCSPRHAWFNVGGIVVWILLAAGGILLRPLYAGPRAARSLVVLWVVIATFGIATCLVPGDVDLALHSLLAVPVFLGTVAVLFVSARALRPAAPLAARTASVTAVVSLLGLVGLVAALGGLGPVGLTERLAGETVYLWVFFVALYGCRVGRGKKKLVRDW